jgi:hypothetical protein
MNGALMTGDGVSTTFIEKFPESDAVFDLREMLDVKFPALLGLPLKTPCWLRVKPGGKPMPDHVPLVTFEDVNFILGFGEDEGGGYGKPTVPVVKIDGELLMSANEATEPKKKAARKERVRDIVKIRNQNTQQAPCHKMKSPFL